MAARVCKFLLMILLFSGGLLLCAEEKDGKIPADPLRDKGMAGDVAAQMELGNQYFFGDKRPRNYTIAAWWFRKAALQNCREAQFNLGLCYENGLGVKKDRYQAFQFYKQAAEGRIQPALLNMAIAYMQGIPGSDPDSENAHSGVPVDREKAFNILVMLKTERFIPAYRELADWHLSLDPDEQTADDLKKAFEYAKYAAEHGDADAMRILADCYYLGRGCAPDPAAMFEWIERSARRGNIEALAKLAWCYEYGNGCKPDEDRAFKLYQKAASSGLPMAMTKLGDCYTAGKYVKQDIAEALKWYKQAAESDNSKAIFRLGVFAAQGVGMEVDQRKAAEYFLRAARLGDVHAQFNIACYFMEGNGIPADIGAAFYWFSKAAQRGDARAQRRLGICYLQGLGVEKNTAEAAKWLEKSARNGDPEAIKLLSMEEE